MRVAHPGFFVVALTVLAGGPVEAAKDLKGWSETEVRYLLTDEERGEWKRLEDDGQRQEFIARFWARRDPTPDTPANEYQEEIAKRVKTANRLFRGEGLTGWATDRGRIYLLFGPPHQVVEDASGAITEDSTSFITSGTAARSVSRGRITWTYQRVPDRDLPPNSRFVFAAGSDGAYRLANEVDPRWLQFSSIPRAPGQGPVTTEHRREELEPPRPVAADGAPGAATADTVAVVGGMTAEALYFPAKDKVLVAVPFQVQAEVASGERLELVVAVRAAAEAKPRLRVLTFEAAAAEPLRSFVLQLPPGPHEVDIRLRRTGAREHLASARLDIEVPQLGPGLALSSVVLARALTVAGDGAIDVGRVQQGIVLGNVTIDAAPRNQVPSGSTPEAFFFLNGASADPASGAIAVKASFRILKDGKEVLRFPEQTLHAAVNAQPIPLGGLAPGAYQLEIDLSEGAGGAAINRSIAFEVL